MILNVDLPSHSLTTTEHQHFDQSLDLLEEELEVKIQSNHRHRRYLHRCLRITHTSHQRMVQQEKLDREPQGGLTRLLVLEIDLISSTLHNLKFLKSQLRLSKYIWFPVPQSIQRRQSWFSIVKLRARVKAKIIANRGKPGIKSPWIQYEIGKPNLLELSLNLGEVVRIC
jgi:hypothetical protein